MKKLLLVAAAIVGFSSAYADVIKLDGAQTLVTDLVEGKQYLIFDASKITQGTNGADQDRYAFRYVNTTNDAILGDHSTKPTVDGVRYLKLADIDAYLWTVTGNSTDGWYFQNVATQKYIPMGNNYDGNMKVVADKPEKTYKFIESSETHKAFIVAQSDGNGDNAWDGRNNPIFSMTNWSKQSDISNNHWYQFVEYDASTMTPDASELQAELASEIAKLPELSDVLTSFKDNTPGYYSSLDDENLNTYKTWVNQVTALTTATDATVMDLLKAIDDVKATVAAGGPGVNTNLGVAEGKYKIFCRDNGFIYDANRGDNHVMTSTQVGNTEYCSDPNSVDENNHYWEVVADGDNYYIRNVGSQKYLVAPTTQSAQQYWTLSETEHSAITIKTSALRGYPQVEILGNNVHMGITGGWSNQTYVVSYYASNDEGSPFTFASELDAAKDALKAAIDAKTSNIGTGVGKYSYDNDGATVIANAQNVYDKSEATVAELKEATTAVEAVTKSLNPVVPGRFYRFQNVSSSKYITNSNNTASPVKIPVAADAQGNMHTDVFYYDGQHLVSYTNGLVIGKFLSTDNYASWHFFDKDATDASANIVFGESATAGKYTICPSDGRYLHGAGDVVDCGSSDADNGYRWTITQVDWLPVYFGDAAEATIYSPVGLTLSGRAKAHTLYVNTEEPAELVKTEVPAIEPNIPYLLTDHTTNTKQGWDTNTKCVYLQVNYSGAAIAAENPNALSGSIYATQKAADKSYFTLGTENEEAHFLAHSADATYVPGFNAHYAVATDNVVAEGKYKVVSEENKTTGISEMVAGGENGAKVIYDLQGRRVANASKGIFIINGVKTLVK